jgi:preprotein translocase subunit SecA
MNADDIADAIAGIRDEVINVTIDDYIPPDSLEEQWDIAGLEQALERDFAATLAISDWLETDAGVDQDKLRERIVDEIEQQYDEKIRSVAETAMRQIEKSVMLQQLDIHWKEHLAALDYLRQGIHLRGYAQKNPKQEYKREAFEMFGTMLDQVKHQVISILSLARLRGAADVAAVEQQRRGTERMQFRHAAAPSAMEAPAPALAAAGASMGQGGTPQAPEPVTPYVRSERKVGRNEPCPCGSGKKFKHCHGRLD